MEKQKMQNHIKVMGQKKNHIVISVKREFWYRELF